ncbi:MAG: glycerol-3-phosphate 1-O-acyltransferase PlsY [Oscillospiraceae bacterium]|jgi:glycerol-3-phosphate acyltransferase PlsY|nr:glycerol-3-phosphate 1-O-acyltransferase PlsY [Oscillospiraceae bacterium]
MNLALMLLGIAFGSYLTGSLNFAVILSKYFYRDDIRSHGSGNAGMTNMLRTFGKKAAAITAAGDFAKTAAAVLISRNIFAAAGGFVPMDVGYVAGIFVFLGHAFPLWFGFKGGKGVITTLSIMLCVSPVTFAVIVVIFVPLVFITRIVSLSSVLGAVAYPVITLLLCVAGGRRPFYDTLFAGVFSAMVLILHRENIQRLLNGTESKFVRKK